MRPMLKEIFMVSVVLVLVLLNLITPGLMGSRESDISTIPVILINATGNETQVYVKGGLADFQYKSISIQVTGVNNSSFKDYAYDYFAYAEKIVIPRSVSEDFSISVVAYVKESGGKDIQWIYNCTVRVEGNDPSTDLSLYISQETENGMSAPRAYSSPFKDSLHKRRV